MECTLGGEHFPSKYPVIIKDFTLGVTRISLNTVVDEFKH